MGKEEKVISLWLSTGKKLDCSQGIVITEKGVVVRFTDTTVMVVPLSSVVAMEVSYGDKDSVDRVFNE